MELALVLVVLVFVNTVFTVWLLARHRQYLGRIAILEGAAAKPAVEPVDLQSYSDFLNLFTEVVEDGDGE